MRVIFESDEEEDFLELVLNENDLDRLKDHQGIQKNCLDIFKGKRNLNLFIRRGSYAIEER